MSATASWQTQVAIVTALRAADSVTSLLADGANSVVDEAREGILFPYVVVGEGAEQENIFFGQSGHYVTQELYIYTQDGSLTAAATGSAGYRQALAIADAIMAVLQSGSFAVTDHDVIDVSQFEDWGRERLDDGMTRCVHPKVLITLEDSSP